MECITISQPGEWTRLKQQRLDTVVDPMVFRSADVFLRGGRSVENPKSAWDALDKNIGSLCSFFDALILEKCLPMFNYSQTFPADQHTGRYLLVEWCNERGPTLQPVDVCGPAYDEVKREALRSLHQQPDVAPQLAQDIQDEISAFEWEWRPDLFQTEYGKPVKAQDMLAAYRYGGLLFGGYAQRLAGSHVLQPKRARLFVADRLQSERADGEAELFARLTRFAAEHGSRTADWPASPTFLPWLLMQDPPHPRALLDAALKLRSSDDVAAYRTWRHNSLSELVDKGRIRPETQRELNTALAAVAQTLEPAAARPAKIGAKIGAKLSLVGPELSAEAGVEKEFDIALGWLPALQGGRHIKVLQQLVASEVSYGTISRHLRRLWDAAPKL